MTCDYDNDRFNYTEELLRLSKSGHSHCQWFIVNSQKT